MIRVLQSRASHAARWWFGVASLLLLSVAGCTMPVIQPPPPAEANSPAAEPTAAPTTAPAATEAVTTTATADTGDNVDVSTETYKEIPVGFTAQGYPFRGSPDAPVTMYE